MITFPNAKINLGLRITSKREDGYHNLETIFYPIQLTDGLEITESSQTEKCNLLLFGDAIAGDNKDNLVAKAYALLDKDFNLPNVDISLIKKIPSGAGLGGGSSDASFTLKMLNEIYKLNLSNQQLENYASKLGADCPFFIENRPMYATETGNKFQNVELDLSKYKFVIVKPDVFISTKEAFRNIIPKKPSNSLLSIIETNIYDWKDTMINDFEDSIFKSHLELSNIKSALYQSGAIYASMSGSGSAFYGIFEKETQVNLDIPTAKIYYL